MFIIIPIGGIGQRFKQNRYIKPKALIEVDNKPIIFHLLDNLNFKNIYKVIIPYNKEYSLYNFESKLTNRYKDINFEFIQLSYDTRGAAETISIALTNLINKNIRYPESYVEMKEKFDKPILCLDSDAFYLNDIIDEWGGENKVFTFTSLSKEPKYSYITIQEGLITNIVEKNKISNNACTGAYGFDSYYTLLKYCNKIIKNNIKQKGEFYTSGVIKEMIKNDIQFCNSKVKNKDFYSLGTPEQVQFYEHAFLLDLDGTLVDSDPIYVKVWDTILKKYNLSCDRMFFDLFIKSKSDIMFLKFLINDVTTKELNEISNMKDELFMEYAKDEDVLIDGVKEFFDKIQNSRIAVVTSSNRKSAEFLLKKNGLNNYINILISSNDVNKHKPNPESYLKAMDILEIENKKCIIFEDSKSGYLAAKNSEPFKIYTHNIEFNQTIMFNRYKELNYKTFFDNINTYKNMNLIDEIRNILDYLPIKDIYTSHKNVKTGYICDIDKYTIEYINGQKKDIILKISNYDNELAKTAKKINLYDNELYFYDVLSKIVDCVNFPKYYGSFYHENREVIIMEDLNKYNGIFNINLNKNIDILLTVVRNIYNLHNTYYFGDKKSIGNKIKRLKTINKISYYQNLINNRFNIFIKKNSFILTNNQISMLTKIYKNYSNILNNLSAYPLSLCHGDLKSPNIFYKDNKDPYLLDWQYVHLNKGVSDIVFLMVESLDFNERLCDTIFNYYYILSNRDGHYLDYDKYLRDLKNSLYGFPFFVMVWFGSEDNEKLIDKSFPIRFMKNLLKYYKYYG